MRTDEYSPASHAASVDDGQPEPYEGFSPQEAKRIIQAGCDLYSSSELNAAADIFKGLLALNPHDPFIHTAYGMVLKEQGDEVSAVREFDSAIEEDPKMPVALLNRGILMLKRGNLAGLEDLRAVTALNDGVGDRAREIVRAFDHR